MKYVYGIASVFLIVSVLVYAFHPTLQITDLLAIVAAMMAFGAAAYTWLRVKIGREEGIVWLLLSIGLFLWLGGESVWFYLEAILEEEPFPSAADYLWLLGYPVLFMALFFEKRRLGVDLGPKRRLVVLFTVVVAGIIMIWAWLYPILISSEISNFERFLELAYPIGDLAILWAVLLVALVYLGGRLGRAWLVVSVGFALQSLADLAFSYMQWEEIYWSGHPIDLFWLAGYTVVFVGAALYRHAYENLA